MNTFLLPTNDRIQAWRDLRIQISNEVDIMVQLELLAKWWSVAPISKYVLDPNDSEFWPVPWELITENRYCETTIAYMMAHTLLLAGIDETRIKMAFMRDALEEVMVVILDDHYVLNFSYGEVFDMDEIDETFKKLHVFKIENGNFVKI